MTTQIASSFVNEMEAYFIKRTDLINRWGNAVASLQALPGLVGFWPMSSVQRSTGLAYDLSGQGRNLTYNGNPTYNISGLVPYIGLDGTGDFLSRADETDLDILGSETIYAGAVRGLTIGGWFWADSFTGSPVLINKYLGTGSQKSYLLQLNGSGGLVFDVSSTGANDFGATSTTLATTGSWFFCAGRYIPSVSVASFINNAAPITNTTSIPAALFNSTASLNIGRQSDTNANLLTGRASLCFLCANALPDALISSLFEQTRVLFGV